MDDEQKLAQLNESRNKEIVDYADDDEDDELKLEENELEEIKINPPAEPSFPIFIFGLAMLKDVIDIFSAGLLGWLAAIFLGVIIWLWIFSKSSFIRKRLIKRLIWPIILWIFVSIFPWLNFVPESSILVGLIYSSEKGLVKKIMDKLEKYMEYIERVERLQLISRI